MSLCRSAAVAGSVLALVAGTAVATAGSAAAAAPPRCTADTTQLSTASTPGQANGHFGVLLHVVNTSAGACAVNGYPTVTLLDASGHAVRTAAKTPSGYNGGAAPVRTVLGPGQQATALLEGVVAPDPSSPSYASASSLRVKLPGDTRSVRVTRIVSNDPGLQVHGLIAGATGGARGTY